MLGVKVNWKAVRGTPMAATLVAMQAEQEAGLAKFIRMAGHSRSGPCAVCAQYFRMVHDKSGRIVPLVKLHRNCVCRDVNQKLASDLGKVPLEPMKRFEWVESVPMATQRAMLGKTRTAVLQGVEDQTAVLKTMLTRRGIKKIDTLMPMLEKSSVTELRVMGLRQGMKPSELAGLSKEQLSKNVLSKMRGGVVVKPKIAPKIKPTKISTDKQPWNMTKEEFIATPPAGYEYDPKMSSGLMAHRYKPGITTVGDKFFKDPDTLGKMLLLKHEEGHELVRNFNRDWKDVIKPLRLDKTKELSVSSKIDNPFGASNRAEEVIADAYAALWTGGLGWFETPTHPANKLLNRVIKIAKRERLLIP